MDQFLAAVIDFQDLLEEEEGATEKGDLTMEVREDIILLTILSMVGIQNTNPHLIHIILGVTVQVEELVQVEVYDLMKNISETRDMLMSIPMGAVLHRHSIIRAVILIEATIQITLEENQVMETTTDV